MLIPAQRTGPRLHPPQTLHVHGGPTDVSSAVRELSAQGWQATSAIRVDADLWRLVVRRR